MGPKRTRQGEHLCLYIAILTIVFLCGCAALDNHRKLTEVKRHLRYGREFLIKKDFDQSLIEYEKALSLSLHSPPGDTALFYIALLYSHYENPGRNYGKSVKYLERLKKEFPESPLIDQAGILIPILQKSETEEERRVKKEKKKTPAKTTKALHHLHRAQELLLQNEFDQSLAECEKALSLSPRNPPGDTALFHAALLYTHHENPKKDYEQSLGLFRKLVEKFPQSGLVEEAKIWIEVLRIIEKAKQVDIEIEEKKKELAR